MFKQVSKQLLCLLCAVICTCALSSPCMAADISSIEDGVIELITIMFSTSFFVINPHKILNTI